MVYQMKNDYVVKVSDLEEWIKKELAVIDQYMDSYDSNPLATMEFRAYYKALTDFSNIIEKNKFITSKKVKT